jgi:hypothetical protein
MVTPNFQTLFRSTRQSKEEQTMRKTLSKLSTVLYLSAILMMGLGLSLGCAVPSVEAQSLQKASEVRQPQGDESLEAFWNNFEMAGPDRRRTGPVAGPRLGKGQLERLGDRTGFGEQNLE